MNKLKKKTREAFTLIEMVIVLFIISLLLLLIVPNLANQKSNAVDKTDEAFRTTLQAQVDIADTKVTDLKDLKLKGRQAERAEKFSIKDGEVVKNP
ncbi:prepilin-type N-terminal cleavage/methylation domain-containing protein [Companilactobacillus kedongensis]|uniref:prepilin-type N-terminal cleavage/methylation domain-containing protein n=1 Tax=Companilactobacillus kedongensis TaxID=2486004 RepID=UPI000F79D08E|nr:prepilin-type N-terminal cleavage/methylation domain-containing protein [Companilactobacillus kedongensis]